MPSLFVYDIASVVNRVFPSEKISALMDMPIEQFFDLVTYAIISAKERGEEEGAGDYVNNITTPTPIKNGGWF